MPKVSLSAVLPADPARVWQVVGNVNAFPTWHPGVQRSELSDGGRRRTLTLVGGGVIVDALQHHSDREHVSTYAIVDSPLPVKDCQSTIRLSDHGDGHVTMTWSSEFVASGAPETMAVDAMQSVYHAGLENLKRLFDA